VYRLWDAGVLVPLVGASGKDSNRVAVGSMRTYAKVGAAHPTWVESVRVGRTFASHGPLLDFSTDGNRVRAAVRSRGPFEKLEVVANGQVVASGGGDIEAEVPAGWVAARCSGAGGVLAHTSPVAVGEVTRKPEAVAAVLKLIDQTRAWVEDVGRFSHPKRKQALLDRCAEAAVKLAARP
jgi:hypothetical protein